MTFRCGFRSCIDISFNKTIQLHPRHNHILRFEICKTHCELLTVGSIWFPILIFEIANMSISTNTKHKHNDVWFVGDRFQFVVVVSLFCCCNGCGSLKVFQWILLFRHTFSHAIHRSIFVCFCCFIMTFANDILKLLPNAIGDTTSTAIIMTVIDGNPETTTTAAITTTTIPVRDCLVWRSRV